MRYGLLIFIGWIGCCSVSYGAFDSASTKGNCSPIINGGNVTITCEGLSEGAIKTLNELLNKVGEVKDLNNLVLERLGSLKTIEQQLTDANTKLAKLLADQSGDKTTIQSLNQMIGMLNKEKSQLEGDIKALNTGIEAAKLKAAEEWAQRFRELQKQLAKLEEQINAMDGEGNLEAKKALSQFAKQAQQQLEDGKLDEAGRLYDELIAKVKEQRKKLKDQLEKQIELMDDLEANASHQRGQVYLLQHKPLQALPFLESAYRLRPASKVYAHAYAVLLQNQNQHAQAISIYEQNLQRLRDKGDKADVARTLNNLGLLYKDTQRFKEGEASYQEALTTYRDLAKANPQAYLPDIAVILNNLGTLYSGTRRLGEGEMSLKEALTIRRELAKANQVYHKDVADTLNNLGILYELEYETEKGEASLTEALTLYRNLAKVNPQAYLPDVARTLNNLGELYRDTQQLKEAEAHLTEALVLRRDFAKANPQAYSSDVAMTLNNLGNLYNNTQRLKEAEVHYIEALTIERDLTKANSQAYRKDLASTLLAMAALYFKQDKKIEARRYSDEAIPLYRELWQAYPELYAAKFWTSLALNAYTFPPEDIEKRCPLLKEVLRVAPVIKNRIVAVDQEQGGHCKFPAPEK